MSERIPVDALVGVKAARLICWPEATLEVIADRVEELIGLGVHAIILTGRHKVAEMRVLGKGHTGLVLTAETREGLLALKARRSDADRSSMVEEARLLSAANAVGVGPRLHSWSTNFLMMELTEGIYLSEWIRELTPEDGGELKRVLAAVTDQARCLDVARIDHGELVRLRRHIILSRDGPVIIDFESASTERRPANVTTVIQSLFLNTKASAVIEGLIGLPDREELMVALRAYKVEMSDERYLRLRAVARL